MCPAETSLEHRLGSFWQGGTITCYTTWSLSRTFSRVLLLLSETSLFLGKRQAGCFAFSEILKRQNRRIRTSGETNQMIHRLPLAKHSDRANPAGGLGAPAGPHYPLSFDYSFVQGSGRWGCKQHSPHTPESLCSPCQVPPLRPGSSVLCSTEARGLGSSWILLSLLLSLSSSPSPIPHHLANHRALSISPAPPVECDT